MEELRWDWNFVVCKLSFIAGGNKTGASGASEKYLGILTLDRVRHILIMVHTQLK